ncbi:iron-sulfur cluster assembly scaffold protein [Rhizorhapis sp. SPR117]|uniref:iron-sulfur cluster assembly scaffold protein n=1 Tax=Rhizorhapis sp. SPR117 TaxID=2912611 RepID=UPI001F3F3D81|nr:iron-sulfur cluster assembly scaffold protein [Rhizorhapis sp. SPR117]
MNAPLYNRDILRLAASIPHHQRLIDPQASVVKRSMTCGSRVIADVRVDARACLIDLGLEVRACALGQASASLMASHAIGKSLEELVAARDALADWLAGQGDTLDSTPDFWPGFDLITPARNYPARHPSIRLGFEAVAEAMAIAAGQSAP